MNEKFKKQPLTREQSLDWAKKAHLYTLRALMDSHSWNADKIVFHGGTSLHLSWNSPRYSEDLDFLLSKDIENIDKTMSQVEQKINELFLIEDANFSIEVVEKTKDKKRMPKYEVKVSHHKFHGKTKVKLEFWKVDENYLKSYPSQLRTPKSDLGVDMQPMPVADLETAFCDKLTAFATRPFLKWRDIYDLWWLGTQTDSKLVLSTIVSQFKHNLTAYTIPEDMSIEKSFNRFINRDTKEIVNLSDPDLKKWLSPKLWRRLENDNVMEEMVLYTKDILAKVSLFIKLENQRNKNDNLQKLPKRFKK